MAKAPQNRNTGTKPAVKSLDSTIIGTSGVRHSGGYVYEEFLPELQGVKGRKAYRQMADNDPIIGAMLLAFKTLFRAVDWSIQAVDNSPKALEAKDFVDNVFKDMDQSFADVMANVASMFAFGFSVHEILWKRRVGPLENTAERRSKFTDGKIGIRGLPIRKQETIIKWEINEDTGEILGAWQQPWNRSQVLIPIEKMLLFRTETDGENPEGRSVLRNAYRPNYFKRKLEEIEAIGAERDLAGLPVARIPSSYMEPGAAPNEKAVYQAYQTMITNIKRDAAEGLVLPSDRDNSGNLIYDVSLLTTGGSRTVDTTKILERYDKQTATSVLADFIFLGQSSVGSFALSSDKTALFSQAVMAFVKGVAGIINRDLLPRLWALNGFDYELMPQFVPSDVETPSLDQLAQFISSMTGAGAQFFPDVELENALRKKAGLPPVPEDREDETPASEKPGAEDPNKPKDKAVDPKKEDKKAKSQDELA